ncbi:DMT family transporter [Halomonas sp. ML-15]|nr:DMT family transporter [Halomonas sp. ML-15]
MLWGSSFSLTRIAVAQLTPSMVVMGRNAVAALLLCGLLLVWRRGLPRGRRVWGYMAVIAVIGNAMPFLLISWGQQRIDSGLAGILMAAMPLVTLVLAHFFIDGERLARHRVVGFVVGFAGIVVLIGPAALAELGGQGETLIAQLAVLGASICYAVNTIVARRKPASDVYATSAVVLGMAMLLTLPMALAPVWSVALPMPDPSAAALWAVVLLGVMSTAAGSVVYFKLIAAAGPTFLSLINYLIPLWAVMIGTLFMAERLAWNHLLALVLILLGVAVSQRRVTAPGG